MCMFMCICWPSSLLNRFDDAVYQLIYHELQLNVTVWVFKSTMPTMSMPISITEKGMETTISRLIHFATL